MHVNDPAPAAVDIDLLLVDLLERMSAGEGDALDALCRAHPAHATELRERVEALRTMNLLPADAAANAFPERLGNFRLVRRLGGGGMGVVYEALEEPLGRTVALKLIRPEHLYFPRAKERFRRETQAVSRLSHAGIVALHSVGEANGAPYLAMELVDGATLQQALEQFRGVTPENLSGRDLRAAAMAGSRAPIDSADSELPELFAGSWIDACLRIVLRMSEAAAHAHERGILHRDIKPSNIAITPQGRVVLLDFGLAGLESEGRMTLTGATLGSVLYMAPEQIAGRAAEIDARSDVYSLGVTLYELLALQPPFSGSDAEQTRAAILDGSPSSIRARNREVSRDLELVCFKAIERDRARRYASMLEFGRDLEAVLSGRAVSARPPSSAYRTWRWVKRHPTRSTALAALAAVSIIGPLGLYVGERGQKQELARALSAESAARESAIAERARADEKAREAGAVSSYLVQLFGSADPYRSGTRDLKASDLLRRGEERIESELADQPQLRASLLEHIGESYTNLERYVDALRPLERALDLRLATAKSDAVANARSKLLLASARRLAKQGEYVPLLREALAVLEGAGEAQRERALLCNALLALSLIDSGETNEATQRLDEIESRLRESAEIPRAAHWSVLSMLASGAQRLERHETAERLARTALELDDDAETVVRPHHHRAAALETLMKALREQGRFGEAAQNCAELLAIAKRLYEPGSPTLASHSITHARALAEAGQAEDAAQHLLEALGEFEPRLGFQHPNVLAMRALRANVLALCGRFEQAAVELDEALERLGDVAGAGHSGHATLAYSAARLQLALGRPELALKQLEAARSVSEGPARRSIEAVAAYAAHAAGAGPQKVQELAQASLLAAKSESRREALLALALNAAAGGDAQEARSFARQSLEGGSPGERVNWTFPRAELLLAELDGADGDPTACARAGAALKQLAHQLHPTHAEVRALAQHWREGALHCADLDAAVALVLAKQER